MPPNRPIEQKKRHQLKHSGNWQQNSPMPTGHARRPAENNPKCPERPCSPPGPHWKRERALHFGQRIETDSYNEGANPPENLSLAMSLQPCRRQISGRMLLRDANQVPYTKKCSRKKHEEHAAHNKCGHQPLTVSLYCNSRTAGRLLPCVWRHYERSLSSERARGNRMLFSRWMCRCRSSSRSSMAR